MALLLVLALSAAACDTATDEIVVRNESGQTLDVFLATDGELLLTTMRSGNAYHSLSSCDGPFVLRTTDGDLYAEVPELCRGDPEFIVE
ncbi:MAG: hypothetical protein WD473_00725 [Acidimicrobiia bacterium]